MFGRSILMGVALWLLIVERDKANAIKCWVREEQESGLPLPLPCPPDSDACLNTMINGKLYQAGCTTKQGCRKSSETDYTVPLTTDCTEFHELKDDDGNVLVKECCCTENYCNSGAGIKHPTAWILPFLVAAVILAKWCF